jgi:hypothetical protein
VSSLQPPFIGYGELWPSALFHTGHNFCLLYLFDPVELRMRWASDLTVSRLALCRRAERLLLALQKMERFERRASRSES